MKAMITLTVAEGKRLIAKAVARMPEVVRARESGKILLKGGTPFPLSPRNWSECPCASQGGSALAD